MKIDGSVINIADPFLLLITRRIFAIMGRRKQTERFNSVLKDYDGSTFGNVNLNKELYVCHWDELQPILQEFYKKRTVTFNSFKELVESGIKAEEIDFIRLVAYIPSINNKPTQVTEKNEDFIEYKISFLEGKSLYEIKRLYKANGFDVTCMARVYLKKGVCYNGK